MTRNEQPIQFFLNRNIIGKKDEEKMVSLKNKANEEQKKENQNTVKAARIWIAKQVNDTDFAC